MPEDKIEIFDELSTLDVEKMDATAVHLFHLHNGLTSIPPEQMTPEVLANAKGMIRQLQYAYRVGEVDFLTKLTNRSKFEAQLESQVSRRRFRIPGMVGVREQSRGDTAPLPTATLVSLDLNYLKSVNDDSGLAARGGDAVLQALAKFLRDNLRKDDTIARVGGDEYWMILHETTMKDAIIKLERLREEFGQIKVYCKVYTTEIPSTGEMKIVEREIDVFEETRRNVRVGKSKIKQDDPRYTPPEQVNLIIPSFAFGCAEINQEIVVAGKDTETIIRSLKEAADNNMKKDKIAWKEQQVIKAAQQTSPAVARLNEEKDDPNVGRVL